MVRTYQRKTQRKLTSPRKLEKAAKLVQNGWAIRAAARQESINRTVLWSFMRKLQKTQTKVNNVPKSSFKLSHASRSIFTTEQEEEIKNYCIQVAKMGYGLTVAKVRELAWEVAAKNNLCIPENWTREEAAGIDWFNGFMKRHKAEVSIRVPEACSIARAMAFNQQTVNSYYDKLEEVLMRHSSFRDGSRIYNLDETCTSTVQNTKRLVSPKEVEQVDQIKTAERGTSVTTCVIIGAHGSILPPVMIFPRKIFESNMLVNCFPGTLGLANEKGYNTKETFLHVMKHFVKCTNSSKENPTLLLLDNVETHFSSESLSYAKEHGVVIFSFPPHCTHKLQPLDIGFFGPFKAYYDSAIHSFILSNPSVAITIQHVAGFVREALSKAGSPATIISSFQKPGIYPFNKNVWQESDFLMARVTEQPDPESLILLEDTNSTQEVNTAAPDLHTLQEGSENLQLARNEDDNEGASNGSFIGPEAIRGLPHAKPKTNKRKPRRKGKSMVATDTPEKLAIEAREKEVREKKAKAEERKRKRAEVKQNQGKTSSKVNRNAKKSKGASRVLSFDSSSDSDTLEVNSAVKPIQKSGAESNTPASLSPSEGDYQGSHRY